MTSHRPARLAAASLIAGAAFAISAPAQAQELPDTMTWSSYDVGSAGYAEASAIADARQGYTFLKDRLPDYDALPNG